MRDRVQHEFKLTNKEVEADDFDKYYAFACRFGPLVESIGIFHAIACNEGRTLGSDFLAAIARFPVDFQVVVGSLVKANLAGAKCRGKEADNISKSDIEKLLPGAKHHARALRLQDEHGRFKKLYAEVTREIAREESGFDLGCIREKIGRGHATESRCGKGWL